MEWKWKFFPGDSDGKESACHAGDSDSIPTHWEDPVEKGMATHSSILAWRIPWTEQENSMERTAWQAIAHEATKSWTQLND